MFTKIEKQFVIDKLWNYEKKNHENSCRLGRLKKGKAQGLTWVLFSLRLGKCAEVGVWVQYVPALTIVTYINYAVIIPLRLLGTHCSYEGAAPYKCNVLQSIQLQQTDVTEHHTVSFSRQVGITLQSVAILIRLASVVYWDKPVGNILFLFIQ